MRWTRPLTRKANPDTRCERDDPRLMSRSAHPDVNYPDAPWRMDSSSRCRDGEFATAEEAFARRRKIVDEYLDDAEKFEGRDWTASTSMARRTG